MSAALALVLARLGPHRLRWDARMQRGRACCPAHGGANPSTLSVGAGENGAVLVRCWAGCDVEAIAGSLGLELSDLFPPRPEPGGGAPPLRRRRLLSADQALALLDSEALVVQLVAEDLARGEALDDAGLGALRAAANRIACMRAEVMA